MADFKPFAVWKVSEDEEYKLVLEAEQIAELEDKMGGKNLMMAIGDEKTGMPSLRTMLTVTQAATHRYCHGIKLSDIYSIFDKYISNGGSQVDYYTDVYIKIFQASGFFPRSEAVAMGAALDALKEA